MLKICWRDLIFNASKKLYIERISQSLSDIELETLFNVYSWRLYNFLRAEFVRILLKARVLTCFQQNMYCLQTPKEFLLNVLNAYETFTMSTC